MSVELRPAKADDIEGIQRVAEAAWYAAHAPIIGEAAVEMFLDDYYDAEAFQRYLDSEAALLAVAVESADTVVGFVSARPDADTPTTYQLGRIYVLPDRWGDGIGQRLLQHAEATVAERGGDRISLGVMQANDRAVAFYEAAGYDRVDEFYDDRIETPGYTYRKPL